MSESQTSQPAPTGRPSVCRNCGALIGAGETTCAVCGAPGGAAAAPPQNAARHTVHDRDAMRFARAILTRPAPFTIFLLAANIFVYLLTAFSAGSAGDTPIFYAALVAYGGKVNALINAGQWWRFVTPTFLHGDTIHLLMNMYGLWVLGPYVERLYGSAKFVFFWVVTGIAGVVASYLTVRPNMHLNAVSRFLFKNTDAVSVGASGALFGLIGVLFVFGIKFRHELPDGFKRAFGTGMLPTILLNVFIGFSIPVIDNSAHMGGMLAGAALALVVGYKRPGERASVAVIWHVLQVAALLLVAVCFTMVALHFQTPATTLNNLSSQTLMNDEQTNVPAFLDALNNGQTALQKAMYERDQSGVESAIKALEAAPHLSEKADALRQELKQLLIRAQALPKGPVSERMKALVNAQLEGLRKDSTAWIEKRDQWVKTEGKDYGITLSESKTSPDKQNAEPPDQNQQNKN